MSALVHEALIYGSDDDLLTAIEPHVRAGLAAGDAVLVVLSEHKAALLHDRLGTDVAAVRFLDPASVYRRPATTIAAYDRIFDELDGRRACAISEIPVGGADTTWGEWIRYEAASNELFRDRPGHLICSYDDRVVPAAVLDDVRRTHPFLRHGTTTRISGTFEDPRAVAATVTPAFPAPAIPPDLELHVDGRLQEARRAFADAADAAGIDPDDTAELAVALNEVVTNAILHGGGEAHLRVWWLDGDGLVVSVSDPGPGVDDPLVGFVPPSTAALGGRGMWMARQLFDRVELEQGPDGCTVWLAANPAR